MKNRVGVQVDGVMVLSLLAIGGGVYLYSKKAQLGRLLGQAVDKVNPTHPDNFVNQTAEKIAFKGERNGHSYDTHLLAAVDLVNPFNESDDYAREVWGLE